MLHFSNRHMALRDCASGIMLALVVMLTFLLAAGSALAHATLIGAEPADGAVLDTAPDMFRLNFNEAVSPLVLTLIGPDGEGRALDDVSVDATGLTIAAPQDLADGSHALSWRVISEEGHPVGGTILFAIGAPGGMVSGPAGGADRSVQGMIWAMKLLLEIGLFIGVGGVFFTRWIGGQTPQGDRLMGWSVIAGLLAAVLSFGSQGLDMLGQPLAGLLAPAPWGTAFGSTYARTVALAIIAFLCALVALRGFAARPLSAMGFVGIGLALMASGHVSSAPPHWLTRPAIFLHALMIAFWIGALLPLLMVHAQHRPDARLVLARFSRLIPWSLLVLVGAGITMARVQLAGDAPPFSTAYGRIFIVKLLLVAALLAVAAVNRFWLTGPVMRGEMRAIYRFRWSALIELLLVLAIFATVALWRFTPPPRALAASEAAQAAAGPAILHVEVGDNLVMVHVDPGQAGPTEAEVYVYDMAADSIPAQEVALIMSKPDAGIEPIRRRVTAPDEYDAWHVEALTLPVAGDWQVRVEVLVSDFDMLMAEGVVTIAP